MKVEKKIDGKHGGVKMGKTGARAIFQEIFGSKKQYIVEKNVSPVRFHFIGLLCDTGLLYYNDGRRQSTFEGINGEL